MRNQIIAICSVLCLSACDLQVDDLNNPGLDTLTVSPTRVSIASAATGMLVTLRNNIAEPNGYVAELGVLGRESYILDPADPRFVTELILNPQLDPGSPAFGGNHWTIPYRGIRNATLILGAVDLVDTLQLTDEEKEATRGFTKTIEALEY